MYFEMELMRDSILVEVFWVVTTYNVVVKYYRFKGPCCLHLQVGLLERWYPNTTRCQSRRPRLETSPPWKPQKPAWVHFILFAV